MGRSYDALRKAEAERAAQGASLGTDPVIAPGRDGRRHNGRRSAVPTLNLSDLDPNVEEEYQKLRGNLFAKPGKDDLRSVMVVASHHGEGATTTCVMLAALLAKANIGDVALVDANLRTPSLHNLFTVPDGSKGLTDLVTNGFHPKDLVQRTPIANLSFVPAGRPLKSPAPLYQDQIAQLVTTLRTDFRYVLIDSSPVTDYSDSSFLAPKVDGIAVVLRSETTRIETAVKTKRQLEWAGGNVIGVVLNDKRSHIPMVLERFL